MIFLICKTSARWAETLICNPQVCYCPCFSQWTRLTQFTSRKGMVFCTGSYSPAFFDVPGGRIRGYVGRLPTRRPSSTPETRRDLPPLSHIFCYEPPLWPRVVIRFSPKVRRAFLFTLDDPRAFSHGPLFPDHPPWAKFVLTDGPSSGTSLRASNSIVFCRLLLSTFHNNPPLPRRPHSRRRPLFSPPGRRLPPIPADGVFFPLPTPLWPDLFMSFFLKPHRFGCSDPC